MEARIGPPSKAAARRPWVRTAIVAVALSVAFAYGAWPVLTSKYPRATGASVE
jgi:hypothetical protein